MKKKLTILAFGLLLAVGWTNSAQAQLKRDATMRLAPIYAFVPEEDRDLTLLDDVQPTSKMNAPRRGHSDVYANEVRYTKDDYYAFTYTWYEDTVARGSGQTAHLTDLVTNKYQMYWLLRSTYMNTAIPGILYNDVYQEATQYYGVGHGWNIGETTSPEIVIRLNNQYGVISGITVYDQDDTSESNPLTSWSVTSSTTSIPSNWRYSTSGFTKTSYTYNGSTRYGFYWDNEDGGYICIPAGTYTGHTGLRVKVLAKGLSDSNEGRIYINNGYWILEYSTRYNYIKTISEPSRLNIEAPAKNAYTVFLLKLKDYPEVSQSEGWAERTSQTYTSDLINVFDKYYESIELLTDGLRVGENDTTSGTVFAYRGVLNRFYFIGKGKTATRKSTALSTSGFAIYGPFYEMYEEFSPTTTASGAQTQDFYTDMHGGNYYEVVHDCATVLGYQHYFSMYGKDTTVYKSVSPMVLYIPDLRSQSGYRTYEEGHKPQVGLYTIDLSAETEPVAGYSDPDNRNYIVYLDWTSSLNQMVNNTVPQTYIIYTVTYDANNHPVYTPLDTVYDVTTYEYIVPQQQTSQQIQYVIMGYPTDATNNPEKQQGGIFFVYSNPDDVQIPGWFDFMILYRERYESDFVIQEEKNYYRNYLYPTNLAPGTGMTMEQLKKEWPNQTASYTLWRDNLGIAKLEVRAIGDKVYYRIRYYQDTQVTTGPNTIGNPNDKNSGNATMPYNYVEIPNDNN